MQVEHYFLRYAFPCAHIRLDNGEITKEKYDYLKSCVTDGNPISREELEKIFFRAFENIRHTYGDDYWRKEVIGEYFKVQHNKDIDNGLGVYASAPPTLRNLSKVYRGKVVDMRDKFLLVDYTEGERWVANDFVLEAKLGDYIYIHYGYGTEIASERNC